ncbi:VOC family protein [Camelimonas sp. ID_303_24]
MSRMIFINLPVRDLPAATAFYKAVGAGQNMQFSDETASCMVFSDAIFVMLLTHEKFRGFAPRPIADARQHTAMLIALSADSREEVDDLARKAAGAGGKADVMPAQDLGFMFQRTFADPDGHVWEIVWMDPATVQQGPAE